MATVWFVGFGVGSIAADPFFAAAQEDPLPPAQRPVPKSNDRPAPPRESPPQIVPLGNARSRFGLESDSADRSLLSVDRHVNRELEIAHQLIGAGSFPEAVRQLQRILDSPDDSWLEMGSPQQREFQSAKQHVQDRIGHLPRAARDAYEAEYGQTAKRMLEDASATGQLSALAEVARRFFHTKAGNTAAYLLGSRLLDDSKPLAAAVQFGALRDSSAAGSFEPMLSLKLALCWVRADRKQKSIPILSALRNRVAADEIKIGGRSVRLFRGDEDPLEWLARVMPSASRDVSMPQNNWLLCGGNSSRNAEATEALPLGEPVWKESVVRDWDFVGKNRFSEIDKVLANYESELQERGALTLPAATPLVVGNTVLFRTLARLRAVDLQTGERLWDTAECDRHYAILAAESTSARGPNRLPVNMEASEQNDLRLFLNARAFRDRTYGSLSSDGRRVFAIMEPGFYGQEDLKANPQADLLGARTFNTLAAVDVASGQLLWEIGGARADRRRDLAGAFFLGPGLPLENVLYCLGEMDGEVLLFALDPATGKVHWRQRLVLPLGRLPHFPLRRMAGGSPSFASGLLICPTTGGCVVGVDPSSRTLRWNYQYTINVAEGFSDPRVAWVDEPLWTGRDDAARWLDASPVIADGCVLLTPRDSDELHCVNLADGTLRWKRERGDGLFLAGVLDGKVVIVSRAAVEAFRLEDGSPIWNPAIELALPAGRGFRTGRLYHLPLAGGEFATIDLRKGRVITRSRFPSHVEPGNLVAAHGTLVMQSARSVTGFRSLHTWQSTIADALQQKPDDPIALSIRGEIRLDEGQIEAGLDDLLRSMKSRPDKRVAELAVATVLENLRFDFENSRKLASQIEPLITDPVQRFQFHRLMAAGLERTGDLADAFAHNLSLVQDRELETDLIPATDAWRVGVPQTVAPLLGTLFQKSTRLQRAAIQTALDKWEAPLRQEGNIERLKAAIAALRQLPASMILRRYLVDRLTKPDERAEQIRQLTALRAAGDRSIAGFATAKLARLLLDEGRPRKGMGLLSELEGPFADVPCFNGKTGRAIATLWRSEQAAKKIAAPLGPWPSTHLSVHREADESLIYAVTPLPILQQGGEFFQNWQFECQHQRNLGFTLIATDEMGVQRWRMRFQPESLGAAAVGDSPVAIRIEGTLLQLVMHRRFVVLDAFNGTQPPRLLWTRELFDPKWSTAAQMRAEGLAGLLTADCAFYQIGSTISCSDSITGRVLWERRGIPLTYTLQGDDDYVIALNRNEPIDPSGSIFRSISGEEVFSGAFGLPGPLSDTWKGRRVLTMTSQPGQLTISLLDPVLHRHVWQKSYPVLSWSAPISSDEFVVLDPERRLHFHSIETGVELASTPLDHATSPLHVRISANRYFVTMFGRGARFPVRRASAGLSWKGQVTAIERGSGKLIWSAPISVGTHPIDGPVEAPVLVYVQPQRAPMGNVTMTAESTVTVLDSRTGRTLYAAAESVAPERVAIRSDRESHKIIITLDKCRLEITPTGVPLSEPAPVPPVEAPRPVHKN
jgi:outer membrane protein assembly factor BamB